MGLGTIFKTEAIDLCIFLNNCPPGSPFHNTNGGNAQGKDDNIPLVIESSDGWIEPQDDASHNQIYYFAKDAPAMNWYDADEYCANKGGFLAEPMTSEENNFLLGYAPSLGNVNWWTGLREAEDCKCSSTDARTVSFDANIDYDTLTDRTKNGYVKTKCPSFGNYAQQCTGKVWIWSFSGIRLGSFTDWHGDEPNGSNEHCTVLWAKVGNRWADWGCNTLRDGDSYLFKPLCQKDKDSQEFPGPLDPTTTTTVAPPIITTSDPDFDSDKILPDLLQCIDTGVKYKTPKKDRINNVFQVETANLCRQICSETDGCLYWTWLLRAKNGQNKVCKLKSGILDTGFRRQRNNAVSGTMLNGCNPIDNSGGNNNSGNDLDNRDYCIEYGALYTSNGNGRPNVIQNLNSASECRDRCVQENGCKYFTWKTGKRKNNCELRSNDNFEVKASRKGTSGSVEGKCRDETFDQMTDCDCISLDSQDNNNQQGQGGNNNNNNNQPGGINSDRPSLIDILNGAGFDGRNASPEISKRGGGCGKGQVNRCGLAKNAPIISTATTTTTTTTVRPERVEKGEYCIDHDVNYQEGDEFKTINNVGSVEACRQQCLSDSQCEFYVWKGFSSGKTCHLKSSSLWLPTYESGTVSGTVEGDCQFQTANSYGFCDCVELVPDYYDEDFIDLVETGIINERTNTCPTNQGRRCYAKIPIALPDSNINVGGRIFFGN